MPRGDVEYRQLVDALEDNEPGCRGDWRFVRDEHEIDARDLLTMRGMCRECPVRALCAAFATKARPEAGLWAGTFYPARKRRTRKERTA